MVGVDIGPEDKVHNKGESHETRNNHNHERENRRNGLEKIS